MTKIQTIQLKPGLLVSLKSSVQGGVSYTRTALDADAPALPGAAAERWETLKVVEDPAEHKRACDTRGKTLAEIRKLCIQSAFGLLCPLAAEADLAAAIERARAIIDAFNAEARASRISIYVLRGHIATTDEEAAAAISSEISALVAQMDAGIGKLDPDAIREAASKARALSAMLDGKQGEDVGEAIKQARAAARAIVSRIQKDGEQAAVVLADIQRGALERARIAFLDLDDSIAAPAIEPGPGISAARAAGLDLSADEA